MNYIPTKLYFFNFLFKGHKVEDVDLLEIIENDQNEIYQLRNFLKNSICQGIQATEFEVQVNSV